MENVEIIESNAFTGTGFTKMILPKSCKRIEPQAFSMLEKLEQIELPLNLREIPFGCFENCSNLKEVLLPTSLKTVESQAFKGCSSLKELDLPQSLEYFGDNVLEDCPLVTELVIPDSVTSLGEGNYKYLKSITFGTGLNGLPYDIKTKNGNSKGSSCKNLEKVIIKDSEASFNLYVFYGEKKRTPPFSNCVIKYYYVGRPIEDEDRQSGNTNNNLKQDNDQGEGHINVLEISGKCTEVPYFSQSVDTLVLGENIKILEPYIYTDDLKVIHCKSTIPPQIYNSDHITTKTYTDAIVFVPKGTLDTYQATEGWRNFWDIREDSEMTGINDVEVGKQEVKPQYYDLQGRKLSKPQKGINIINGRKVFLK